MTEVILHGLSSISLEKIIKKEYRDYQIYTLMDRAIPYLQDGLKPSQRRILYTLWKNQNKGLMKVSSLTGLVLTLHPHGPASVESSVVNLAQDFTFSNNYPLLDKKGYFGERMETQAAAARYIECKLGKIAELLLFDDLNQVEMVPNYDEKVMEPVALLPKLPLMLLNGAEGIGTGFSTVIPSHDHRDIIHAMIATLEKGKSKKVRTWVRHYHEKIQIEKDGKIIFPMGFKQKGDSIHITELPKGFDAQRIYRHINKFIEKDYVKDYIDSSVDNDIDIELVFKRGQQPTLEEVIKEMSTTTSLVPNYTLISERGVKIFDTAEDIIEVFTAQRLKVVHRRYELLIQDHQQSIAKNQEIIRFIREKHYAEAEKRKNRADYVDYLKQEKFFHSDYLADLPIYRMTKEEVQKRQTLIEEESARLKQFKQIASSAEKVKEKLIDELSDIDVKLTKIIEDKDRERKEVYAKIRKKR